MNYNIDTLYKQISGIILWSILLAGWYSHLKVIKNNIEVQIIYTFDKMY